MFLRILLWFILFYSLFKLLVRVVLPFLIKKAVQGKMKDRQRKEAFEDVSAGSSTNIRSDAFEKEATRTTAKGDYIDFEEIK